MAIYAFGYGLAVFGKGLTTRPRDLADFVGREIPEMIAYYGPTGNYAFRDDAPSDLSSQLLELTHVPWAVISGEDLSLALRELNELNTAPCAEGRRSTPGLAFAIETADDGDSPGRRLRETFYVRDPKTGSMVVLIHLKALSRYVVAATRCDLLDPKNLHRLDSKHREGGWGRVSDVIKRDIGGVWTSRSRSRIDGLRKSAGESER
jgi:hypothetical protein